MGSSSRWRKVRLALGLDSCVPIPRGFDDFSTSSSPAGSSSSPVGDSSGGRPSTPTPSSSGLRLSKSSTGTCTICLYPVKPGQGRAIFTAECSHSFHFHCITSNVKHGNQICPVCRAKWKEVPFQSPASSMPAPLEISQINQGYTSQEGMVTHQIIYQGYISQEGMVTQTRRRLPTLQSGAVRQSSSPRTVTEPTTFNDDEALDQQTSITHNNNDSDHSVINTVEIRTVPEVSSVPKSTSHEAFAVLIHLKAPSSRRKQSLGGTVENSRASVDLVTVLDTSGSMSGTKLALLKRAMGFLIQNLSPSDRLSVIAFSSTARRVFPLRLMTDSGRQQALQAVNSLVSDGGTNIAEALRKATKVFEDRRWKNPVSSIMLLSDGQDTCTLVRIPNVAFDYQSLVPNSIRRNSDTGLQIPVHSFGFGTDHDATLMHAISEISGGTFSFIEAEDVIQDAFAQCIGGLLSVVVQELQVKVKCVHPHLQLSSVKAGSYQTSLSEDARMGTISVGDLYAEEERDFLVTVNVPADESGEQMSLLTVRAVYQDPITKEMVALDETSEVKILRPDECGELAVSIEVDRQRNRLRAAEAMAEARVAAEHGDLSTAVSILVNCQNALCDSVSARAGDRLCAYLSAELTEMQERMGSQHVYEQSGRAYVLSGLSSHSWQRATSRGDSTDSSSLLYQTPTMSDMVTLSQSMVLSAPPHRRHLRSARSFPERQRRQH